MNWTLWELNPRPFIDNSAVTECETKITEERLAVKAIGYPSATYYP